MKRGLVKGAILALASIGAAGLSSGCKTKPYCENLGSCGGDLFTADSTDFYKGDGLADREWVIVGQVDGIVNEDEFCQDQLQTPPTPVTLLRQPPVQSSDRPPDKVTADWCSNITFTATGKVDKFIVWAPPLPLKHGLFTLSQDVPAPGQDVTRQGTYKMEITYLQTRPIEFTETCLTSQGIRLSCPELGRHLGRFLDTEANIYSTRCFDPPDARGGCLCEYDVSFIGGPVGRWYAEPGSTEITFFDDFFNPPDKADYCAHPVTNAGDRDSGLLELTGHDNVALFNQKSYRTMKLRTPTCSDGIQSHALLEEGVDCGGMCPNKCGTCFDNVRNGDEDGIDCGGSCLGVLCENPGAILSEEQKNTRKPACANGVKEPWEEGVDCGGPCRVTTGAMKGSAVLCTPPTP